MTADLRTMLDADRESLQDVAEWLGTLDQSAFDRHVLFELRGQLDPQACDALRHPANLARWRISLTALTVGLQAQLTSPAVKGPGHAVWRKETVRFNAGVLKRRGEVDRLLARKKAEERAEARDRGAVRRAQQPQRSEAGERAVRRLVEAHRAEFVTLLAEEYAELGLELGAGHARELAELTGQGVEGGPS
jgi:hypothetical protein